MWIDWVDLPAAHHPDLAASARTLAAEGDQLALTFLLNRLLNPSLKRKLETGGIRALVLQKADVLHVMTEALTCPSQSKVGPPVAKFLRQLQISGVAGVRVYGRRAGQKQPLWRYAIDLRTAVDEESAAHRHRLPRNWLSWKRNQCRSLRRRRMGVFRVWARIWCSMRPCPTPGGPLQNQTPRIQSGRAVSSSCSATACRFGFVCSQRWFVNKCCRTRGRESRSRRQHRFDLGDRRLSADIQYRLAPGSISAICDGQSSS